MKKNLLKVVFATMFTLVAGYTAYSSQKSEITLSGLAMANVEALANGEDTGAGSPCYKGSYNSNLPEATKCAHPCVKERCGGVTDKCY